MIGWSLNDATAASEVDFCLDFLDFFHLVSLFYYFKIRVAYSIISRDIQGYFLT
jgi:hypothetical protein